MSSLVKVKLLKIAKSGAFATFSPQQLDECRSQILSLATDKLTNSEIYSILELQFYISLLTNHDVEAKAALDRLLDQFAVEKSQKLKILRSLYLEAIGEDERAIKILTQDPDELDLSRRLTTFSRKKKEVSENLDGMSYISNLIFYLDLNPSDIKTWAELAGEYSKEGNYDKSIYCYKEILLQEPFAYNIFYQVGLQYYYQYLQIEAAGLRDKKEKLLEVVEILSNSRNNFLRSIEICKDYLKGWEGIHKICDLLEFNDRVSSKLSQTKDAKKYLDENKKLKVLSEEKIKTLKK